MRLNSRRSRTPIHDVVNLVFAIRAHTTTPAREIHLLHQMFKLIQNADSQCYLSLTPLSSATIGCRAHSRQRSNMIKKATRIIEQLPGRNQGGTGNSLKQANIGIAIAILASRARPFRAIPLAASDRAWRVLPREKPSCVVNQPERTGAEMHT